MSPQRPPDVLGSLPQRRPQRRSAKRPAPAETPAAENPAPTPSTVPAKTKTRTPARSKTPAQTKAKANTKTKAKSKAATPGRATPAPPTPARAGARERPQRLRQPAQPSGVPATPRADHPTDPSERHLLGTAAQAAAELAEIGLSVSARALRRMVDRLPRP